jgi:hypothetical protein
LNTAGLKVQYTLFLFILFSVLVLAFHLDFLLEYDHVAQKLKVLMGKSLFVGVFWD